MNFDTISELDLKDFFANDNKRAFALDLLRGVDTGIRDFNVVEYKDTRGNEGLDATFAHTGYNPTTLEEEGHVPFYFDTHESQGTRKLLHLAKKLYQVLEHGLVYIHDELDTHLHPLLTKRIIQLFTSKETNPNGAQLIFTTHATNLLSPKVLRRDEIWFTEKDHFGATQLYSLVEFDIPEDTDYESDYLKGKYGAIPYLGDFSELKKFIHPNNGAQTEHPSTE